MATTDTTTAAFDSALIDVFQAQARADGFMDENGFFVGPDDLDADLAGIEWPAEQASS